MSPSEASRVLRQVGGFLIALVILAGCGRAPKQTPQQRAAAARTLFDETAKLYHLPSAEAEGAARGKLLERAAAGYERLLKEFSDQPAWAAPTMRSLANIRAVQGKINRAVQLYDALEEKFPGQDWEILQAWKSAGDLLWENGRRAEAKNFYSKLVQRFDRPANPGVVQLIVRSSKTHLAGT